MTMIKKITTLISIIVLVTFLPLSASKEMGRKRLRRFGSGNGKFEDVVMGNGRLLSNHMCNDGCSWDSDCSDATDGCTRCNGQNCYDPSSGHHHNDHHHHHHEMCGHSCHWDSDCHEAADGCNRCGHDHQCYNPSHHHHGHHHDHHDHHHDDDYYYYEVHSYNYNDELCGISCEHDEDCSAVTDGCHKCVESICSLK